MGTEEYNSAVRRPASLRSVNADDEEFSTFVKHTERELRTLFESIDGDHNGKLDKEELRAAFVSAGIGIAPGRLDEFFTSIDSNHDGVISFEEWR